MALADSGMAIGAVTRLAQDHLLRRSFNVTVGKPEDAVGNEPNNEKLNLFLYEIMFDASMRNLPPRAGEPTPLWMVLKYLLTAFDSTANSDTIAAHNLLGRGVSALQDLSFLPLDSLVAADVTLALENSPEPLKLTFDEAGVELLSKVMQGSDEHYRLSVAFQIRPVMIVPRQQPRGSLLVGIDYTQIPQTVIGTDGVQIETVPTLGARLKRLEPERFEVGDTLTIFGEDLLGNDLEVILGSVVLNVVERRPDRLVVTAEGIAGIPIAGGGTVSAGEIPLIVRKRLASSRTRTSNLLAARLLPSVAGASLAGSTLTITGFLLGSDSDDVSVMLYRADGSGTVRLTGALGSVANQQTLTVADVAAPILSGPYRILLHVNGQQALASPSVVVP